MVSGLILPEVLSMGSRAGNRMPIAVLLLLATMLAAFVLLQITRIAEGLQQITVGLNKITATEQLYNHVLRQSYAIKGYMLYHRPVYLEEFRLYARLSQQEMEQLRQVVRPARQALVDEILFRQRKYVVLCEKEIIPLVERGNIDDAARVAQQNSAVTSIEEMLQLIDKLREMRLKDLNESLYEAVFSVKQALWWGFGGGLVILFTGIISGILLNRRLTLENLVYRLILRNTRNAVVVVQNNGRIYLINRIAEEIFGLDKEAVAGLPFEAVFTGRRQAGEIAFSYPTILAPDHEVWRVAPPLTFVVLILHKEVGLRRIG